MLIVVHSVVDVITNSSTTIYTMADETSIEAIKTLVNLLLEAADSDWKADDLFEFKLEYDQLAVDAWRYTKLYEEGILSETDNWKTQDKIYAECEANPPDWWNDYEPDSYYYSRYVVVTAKDEPHIDAAKALSELHRIFPQEAIRDG